MFKKKNLVLLPTTYGKGAVLHTAIRIPELMCNGEYNGNEFWKPHHLYLISDDEIREGDWYISKNTGVPLKASEDHIKKFKDDRKIIATTDKSLGLPEFSIEFLKDYAMDFTDGNQITEIIVEYKNNYDFEYYTPAGGIECCKKTDNWQLKVNSENCIIFGKEKTNWTKEEVVKLLEKYQEDLGDNSPGIDSEIEKWKEDNL